MLDFFPPKTDPKTLAEAVDFDAVLRITRQFRHVRVVKIVAAKEAVQTNMFVRRGTEMATKLDMSPDNIFA